MASSTRVHDPLDSEDTRATVGAIRAFGASVQWDSEALAIEGVQGMPDVPDDVIDCANSGTTMRLAIGTASLVDGITVLTGDESLRSRPQGPLLDALDELGARAESTRGTGEAPIVVSGPISGGAVSMPGNISSQFISSLLLAGGLTSDGIDIELESPLKSAPYVDMTLEVLDAFGVESHTRSDGFHVAGGQSFDTEHPYPVPADFSSISYLLAAGAVAGSDGVNIDGAYPSVQGDVAIVDIVERMGASVEWKRDDGRLRVAADDLVGIEVDVGDTPDLLPTIAVLGAVADGKTTISNCEHVRYKETDRVAAMAAELGKMGVDVEEEPDVLTITGAPGELRGATVDGYRDHRVIMALAVAGLVADGMTTIRGADHVSVSFPAFFEVLERLGVSIDRRVSTGT